MNELRVPKSRVPLTLGLVTGTFEAEVFLAEYAASHAGPERVLDVVGDQPFFPVLKDAKVLLVARDAVRWARAAAEHFDAPSPALGGAEATVAVDLQDGTRLEGTARFDAPRHRARLLDFLNTPGSFLILEQGESFVAINRRHIAQIGFPERE